MANENRLKLFNALGKAGYDIGSYDDFDRRMNNPEDREKFYNAIGEAGYDIGDRDEFERRISPTKYKFTIDGKEVGVSEKEYKDYVNRQKPDYQQTLDDVQQTLRENQRTMNRIGSQQQRIGLDTGKQVQIGGTDPYRLGENRKVTKGEQRLNPETGQLEDTYITESGNEYESREMADLEQNAVDQAEWERNNPKQAIKNNIDSQIKNIESRMNGYEGQWVDADGRVHYSGGSAGDEAMRNLENARHDLMEARQQMERTEQLQKSSDFLGGIGIPFTKDFFNNWKNFGYAVWDKLSDVGWWEDALTGGVNDLEKAGAYMKIKNKVDSGIPLTDQETDVVLSAMATAQAQQYVDLPMGYTAGEITADMAPFMAQMAVNPASGLGRGLARQAVRRYGRHGIGAVSKRVAARVLGNLGEAAVLSNTLQAPRTIGNAIQRYTGNSFVYDEDGNLHMGHYEDDENGEPVFVEGGDNALSAAYKGEVSSIIENFTELGFGGNVNKFVKKMATSKAGRALGIDYLSDLVGKVGTTPFAKNMKKFMERTHWDGMIEEPLEEEYGIILNAFLGTGDNKISDLWDSEQQAQIFAGTLWFGGMMSAMNTAAYPLYRRRLNQQVAQADTNGQIAFGDEWEVMKDAINMMDDKDIGNYLYSIKDNDAFSNEQKAALFGYAARLKQQQGANVADMLMRMEGNLGDVEKAERAAYDAGAEAETADEKKKFVEDAVKSELNLFNYGKEFATMITAQSDDPANTIDYLLSRRDIYTDEQIAAASDYYQKQARAVGVMDAAEDAINTEVERANAEVRANTHQDTGSIVTVQSGDVPYYVIGGEIVDDGNGNVLLSGTGGAMVVKNALTGEVSVMSPQEMTVVSVQNADDLIQQNETVLREQLTQQADDDITYGSPANEVFDMEDTVALQDGQGGVIEGQIVGLPNAVDGVFVVQTNDGRALQMTADEMNRRIVGHNGVEVQRGQQQPLAAEPQGTEQTAEAQPQPTEQQGAVLDNASGEAGSGQTSGNEPPASALSKIPVRMGADGKPLKGKNGRPILDWHKASVEDAAAALVETAGGDKVMARDTATDLVKNEQARLEKIRKQKPKGDDPIEIAESRVAIRKQEEEQQAVIKHWKDVNQLIQQQMKDEQEQAVREREAAKSEAQRQREAEEARIRQEQQDEQDRQRLREQIEKDKKLRNQEYQPLTQAKKELAGDSDALSVLDDVEPRGLDEWVSYLLRPHSILWKDASDAETGLQTELGLKRGDLQRMMSVVGTSESGAQPFNKIVMEIHEGLPDAMKEQYTDQDVRNTLLGLFAEGSSARMLHLTEEHRIEEAREMMKENERRDAEAELDAWAEYYHLNPEEREDFEDWLQLPPTEPEQEVINNIIAEHAERQSNGTSPSVGEQPVSGTVPAGIEGGQGQVQGTVEAAGNGANAATVEEGAEAGSGEPAVSDNQVAGGTQGVDRETLRVLFDEIGEDVTLADRMSDFEVEQLTAMVDDWEEVNSDYGQVIEEQDKNLKSKNKAVRDAAKAAIDEAQAKANETYEPIEMYLEELNTKYGIEKEEPFEGAIPTPKIDMPRYMSIRQALVEGYRSGDKDAIQAAAQQMQAYVDEGLDHEGTKTEVFDIAEEYDGNDPEMLADQYIIRTYWDRYLDDDADQEYIKTGLKPNMRENEQEAPAVQEPIGKTSSPEEIAQEEAKVDTNPTEGQKEAGNYQKGHINVDGYDITIENPKGSVRSGVDSKGNRWETTMQNTYGYIRGTEGVDGDHIDVFLSDNPTNGSVFVVDQVNPESGAFDEHKVMYGFASEEEAREAYLSNYSEGWQGLGAITEVSREEFAKWIKSSHRKTKPFTAYKSVKKAEAEPQPTEKNTEKYNTADDIRALDGKTFVGDKGETLTIGKFEGKERVKVVMNGSPTTFLWKHIAQSLNDTYWKEQSSGEPQSTNEPEGVTKTDGKKKNEPKTATAKKEKPAREHKRLVSDEKMEELKRRLLEKMSNLNEGLDMERMLIGAAYAAGKIERGVTKFADFCADMIADFGDGIREYLKLFYNGARDLPEAKDLRPLMDDAATVDKFDVFNFDKKGKVPTAIEKAEQVTKEQKVKRQAKKIKAEQGDLFAGDLFGDISAAEPQSTEQPTTTKTEAKPKTPWWSDTNRPASIDPRDYKTYMTDEAKEYFASQPAFGAWKRKDLAFVTAAVWDGVVVPYEALKELPEIVEAEQSVKSTTANGVLQISDKERDQHAKHLLDAEHGSAIFENGKIKKVNGVEDFSGPVRQERKALIIIGYPAAGKSSVFANRLSNEHGARIIDSDTVKPWLEGYDDGNGAGYVQEASSEVAERAIDIAVGKGDNIILPRIGGESVFMLATALKLAGYDVQLYFNDVATVTSVDRATSRFAESGRYLSLDYLTSKDGVPSKNFRIFAEKNIGDYVNELSERKLQELRGRLGRLLESETVDGKRLWQSSATDQGGYSTLDEYLSVLLGTGESSVTSGSGDLIFSYAEWKSNDVAFGEKPKEIWNSKSGQPMPTNDNNNEGEQKIPGESSPVGGGTGQTSRPAERAGAERSSEQNRAERSGSGHSVGTEAAAEPQPTEKPKQPAKPKQDLHKNKRNNVGERGKNYAPTSVKARFNANVEAIKMMRALMEDEVEAPTKDQMEVLRQYSGWGGLGTYFNDETSAENKLLRELLTEEEYNDAVMSINSAYYTPANVIDTLWDIAKAMGFKGGKTLEGSAGIGNIIGQMPQDMSRRSDIEAVEIDTVSGNILRLLYPDATVHIQGFQDTVIPNGSVDLAITNVPFVTGLHVIDKVDKDLSRRFTNIHDFCIAKNIRKLKEGGIGIFITSAGTMDKSNDLRAWITDEGNADVVGAFRLNNETFGGTKVTSDIIVVRKRTAGETSGTMAIDASKASPMRVGTYKDKLGEEKQVSMVVNDYFKEHPEMMAGEMAFGYEKGDTFRPGSYGLYPVAGKDQDKMMQDFVKQMEKVGKEAVVTQQPTQQAEPNQLTAEKEGRMLIDDKGRLCVSERGQAVPLQLNAQKVKGYSKEQCFKDYQEVQQAVDDVLQQQLNDPDDAALEPKLKALNAAFDKFVKRYGNLHKNTSIAFLRNDIDFPSFLALENYSETKDIKGKVTVTTRKAPIFKQRVLGFKTEPEPKTIKDAVIASIFRSNGIDLDWIAERLNHVAAPPNGDNWTTEDVRKGILISRLGFEDPSTGQLVVRYKYLSGNVREKLAIAEQYNASGETAGRYATNVEELRKVVPMDIPAHLIDFSLGSSWIPIQLYKDYLKETYDLPNVKLSHVEGSWILDEGYSFRNEKNRVAGVYSEKFRETIYGHQLVAAALNNRPVKVAKQVKEGWGSTATTKTVVDQAATQACAVRVDEIKEEFKQWAKKRMQDDQELAKTIEKIYNEKFNALVPMEIGDEFLPERFEGSNVNIKLRQHQKTGTMRGLTAPTMLAHEVGTGKSFTLITTAMEMRRLGTAKKPMLVVQNATVAQITADAKLLYPNAKVLSLSEKDRTAEGRRSFYARIKFNDWDLIIVPQSTFERIPDSPERELQFIQEKIDEKKHVIEAAERAGMDARDLSRLERELKALEQDYGDKYLDNSYEIVGNKKKKKDAKREAASLDKAETKAKEMLDRAVDDVQYFDDLGVDALLVDEAHEYKHLGFQTSIGRGIKGIDPSYSKKCAGLYNKTRCVFEKAGWKNVVFATGTPISNTAAEIWTFMKYLMPADVMRENDIYYFDDFVHNFGSISQMLEFATSGKFKENTRFAAYVNKPELMRIWMQVADIVKSRDSKEVLAKLPKKEGGKDQDMFLPQSPSLVRIMAAVRAELERFENMTGQEKKENSSIPLTMYGIAKRAAIDPRLVDAGAPDEPMSKTNAAVKEIVKDLEATKDYKGTVAVFCDNQNRLGKTADGKSTVEFNIYDDMRDKLIKAGVPAEQIAIIKSGMSITAKQKVFDAVNSGDIRVVLGSTQTLGTGVNMQERLHLLIHMDAPDRPMDYTQRNGRIERQGNLHKEWGKTIRIVRFGVEDSLDVTAYQRLKTKSGFIDSIMDGKGALKNNQVDRTVEEEEEGLFDNPVAVLSGSQYALKKNQAERELRKYQGKKAQWEADQVYVTNQLRHNKNEVEADQNLIRGNEQELEHVKKMFPDGNVKVATVESVKVDLTKDDGAKKLNEAIKEKINDPVNAIVKRNRENPIYNDETLNYTIELDGHPINFKVEVVREAEHENGRIKTVIHKFTSYSCPDLHIETSGSSRSVKDFLDEIMEQVVTGQDYQDRIDALKASIERINRESEQLQQRVGLEFQFGKELEEAQKHVEEYTELMKKEMEEKEAKYAAQQKEASKNGGFDLHKAEESEEDEDLYSTEEDWDNTKTEAFKDYFGDWENDPENASKVVDADGRPLVVYHYTNLTRNNKSMPFWEFQPYSHFGTRGQAKHVDDSQHKKSIDILHIVPQKMELTKTYPVYLNIRKPKRVEDVPLDWDETHSQYWGMQIYLAAQEGYDGIVYLNEYEDPKHPADSWIAFYPEQVKSADENVGNYDPTLRDIRYRDYEVFSEGERIPINVTFGYSDFDVTGRSASYSVDLMPDTYTSEQDLLEAVRRQYPAYYVHVEDGQLVMDSWKSVMKGAEVAVAQQHTKQAKAHESFIERKTRNAINAVENLAKRMGLDVEVLTNTDGLTGKKARAKGWFNPKTHKIVIVLPNHANQSDLINTLLHEGVAHYGLRNMFGPSFDTFLDNVYNNVSPEIKARIDAAMKRNGWSQHTATEEYLARLAERTDFEHATEQGWWQKIKMFFLDMIAKAGFSMELSDNDLRYILWRSYDNLLHPDSRRNIFDKAREVEMQRKLDIRRTRERNRLQATGRTDTNWIAAESISLYKEANALIDDLQRNGPKNMEEELSIRSRVRQLPENQLQYAYNRINDMMLDDDGLDLDEHFEKTQQDWIAANGIKGLGKVVADDMQAAMDKYGSGMIELRWELLERINELGAAEPLMRDDDAWSDDVAQETYEKEVAKKSLEWQEAWQDSMASLKAIQDAIAKETGNVATGAEDAYHYENRMHGKAKNMAERYDAQHYRPMLKAFYDFCKKQGLTVQQGMDYLVGKSGLERNQYFAFRDAMKEKLAESIKAKREKLEKDYAKGIIDEGEYKYQKSELEKQEREGVDDAIKQLHEDPEWTQAKEDYDNGDINYEQLLDRRERLMRRMAGGQYDAHNKDYSGLTETFAKIWYDEAQEIKKQAQRAIDREEKRQLWSEYDQAMKTAYETAKAFATDAVTACENTPDGDTADTVGNLWSKINAATEETLKESYENGLMDRATYNKVRAMFDYYVPLRGWDEDKASDVYTYMGKENVFSPAVKKTWGRTSKAENPLAYIGNIAISTILSGERNQMKQHFLNYVMNNPTSLVSVSESWYENIGSSDGSPVWVLRSADTAGKSGDELADAVNDFNEEMRLKARDGKAIPVTGRLRLDVHATQGQKAEHVVEVQRAGHTYQLYINGNPKAAQALNGSAARAVSRISDTWLGKHITNINRNMAAFFTSKNPAFVISNLSRDLNMAGASVAVNESPAYNAQFIANVAKVLSPRLAVGDMSKLGMLGLVGRGRGVTGLMPKLMRKYQEGKLNTRNGTERLFKEFMDEGGETGFVNMLSIDSFKQKMQREIEQMNGSSLFGRGSASPYGDKVKETSIHKALRLLGDTFEFYNRCAEDATRFIVYMTSRQMGKTLEESIADAKDVTLNFNRKGTGAKGNAELRDLFIFVNPAIQALSNMYRMLKGHPLKLGAVTAAFVTVGALMPIINQWLLNMFGDDDDKDAYWNLPPWVRKNNLVMWMPGTKNFVTIPLAQEFRVFYGVGEMASSLAMEHPVDKWGLEIFSSVADLVPINPTGNGGNLMVDFAPTMVQPLMQIGENVDFTGKPIWRENQGNKYAPMYTKAYVTTPRWMTKVSESINDLTGGNEGKKGIVEKYSPIWGDYINNPAVWNHLLQGYFGGMYNTVAKAFDVGVTAASGEIPKVYQTPVINRFLNRPVERDNAGVLGDDYYHLKEQRDALQYELKVWQKKAKDAPDGDPSKAVVQEHVDEILNSDDWKRAEVITHYERIIKELKAGEQAATDKEDKQNIKRSISLYKQQMMEELAAIDGGAEPLDAAMEQYRNAKSLSEKKKLKLRIERLSNGSGKPKVSDSKKAVEKALSYQLEDEAQGNSGTERYLELATAENVRDDARIKAAKALIKPYTDQYKQMMSDNKTAEAAKYRKDNAKWFAASQSIGSHERAIAENRKLLGKGNDAAIMKIIDIHRRAMFKAIEQIE